MSTPAGKQCDPSDPYAYAPPEARERMKAEQSSPPPADIHPRDAPKLAEEHPAPPVVDLDAARRDASGDAKPAPEQAAEAAPGDRVAVNDADVQRIEASLRW